MMGIQRFVGQGVVMGEVLVYGGVVVVGVSLFVAAPR
jgi:hypothetical protein